MKQVQPTRKRGVILTTQGWRRLQKVQKGVHYTIEALSDRTNLDPATVSKVLHREVGVDKRTLERFFAAFDLELDKTDYGKPELVAHKRDEISNNKNQNWYEAPDVSLFYGRTEELQLLEKWILQDKCRLIALVGIGGIGKTALSVKLSQKVVENFDYFIWQSLSNAPPPLEILATIVQFLSDGEETDLPNNINYRIKSLLGYLRSSRCLLVFDNVESIFAAGNYAGYYRHGYEAYGEIFRRVGETFHQSCLLLTSRDKPKEIASFEGSESPVRSFKLSGLSIPEVKEIFRNKGILEGTDDNWQELINRYQGNPLYLKIIATTVQDLFNGSISEFIAQDTAFFGDVRNILDQQFNRLSKLEHSLIYWLAINREPIDLTELKSDIISSINLPNLLEIIESLYRRSLIEKSRDTHLQGKFSGSSIVSNFTLQPAFMEYVTAKFIEQICQEIVTEEISLFASHALIKATSPDYIRESQIRLIITPILDKLKLLLGNPTQIENQLINIIDQFRNKSPQISGYAGGNAINLLANLSPKISNRDFSHITIWQAYLQDHTLHQVNFQNSSFAKSIFTEAFGIIFSLAFSQDDQLLATGSIDGEIYVWCWRNNQQIINVKGHTNIVEAVNFSPSGEKLVSTSRDKTIKLWDVSTGQCISTFRAPDNSIVRHIKFSPDGQKLLGCSQKHILLWDIDTNACEKSIEHSSLIRSTLLLPESDILVIGCADGTVSLWDFNTKNYLKTVQSNYGAILSVINANNSQILACSIADNIIKIWDINTGKSIQTLQPQNSKVLLAAFSSDGQILATVNGEKIVKIWDVKSGKYLQTLEGHISAINAITFSIASNTFATASVDRTVKLWNTNNGKCWKTLQGRSDFVHSVAFSNINTASPEKIDDILVSASKHSIRIWDIREGKCLKTFYEYRDWLNSLTLSPMSAASLQEIGQMLACGNLGNTRSIIRIWRIDNLEDRTYHTVPEKILHGHTDSIWSVDFSPLNKTLVSGSGDKTIKIWDCETGECLKTLKGHKHPVISVAFSPKGDIIASCGGHSTVKLWDVETGECRQTLQERACYTIIFSPNENILASGSTSGIVKLWDVSNGRSYLTLGERGQPVTAIAFSPNGKILATGSKNGTMRLWEIDTGKCVKTFPGNMGSIWSLAFSSDGILLAAGCDAEIVQLWNVNTYESVKTFRSERPLEGTNLRGATGLTAATIANLKTLGVIE